MVHSELKYHTGKPFGWNFWMLRFSELPLFGIICDMEKSSCIAAAAFGIV
jgi:hypothetical protein